MDFKQFYKDIYFDIDNNINVLYTAKQGDIKSRGFYVTILQKNKLVPVTTQTMTLYIEKPDKTRVLINANKDEDKFRIDLTNQVFAVPGELKCELSLRGESGEQISTRVFKMLVGPSIQEGAIVSKDERGVLDRAFELATDMIPRIELIDVELLEDVQVEMEGARTDLDGTVHASLKERLDKEQQDLVNHKLDYIEDKKEIKKDISTLKQIAHYDEVLEEYIRLDQFWNSLRNGKVYTTEFYQFDVSPSPSGVKKDDNEGLVCEPSTNTVHGRNDYEKIGLFMSIDVNAYVDENDDYHVTAIEGDGRFKSDGTKGDVYVMSMPGYIKRYKDEEVWSISYSDAMHPGFEVIDEAVKPDGTIRPYLLHAKYIAGRNPHENNNLASISGVPAEHVGMSHNGQIAEFKEKGIQYSGKTSHDDFYVQLMLWLKYATTHSQSVMYGATSGYYLQYSNLVSEVGVKRVVVTNSQANNLLVGSTVSIGDYGDGEISANRSSAQNSNLADRVNIIDIADLGDGNSAVYVDSEVEFKTSLTTTITTYPWNSGSCDNVLGQDGSPYDNLSGKEPFIINGIEMIVGGYEVLQNLIIHNNSDDDRTDVYVNYDCHTYSTSPTADYDLAGQLVSTGNVWKYGSKLSIPDNHPSVMLITKAEASSTTGFADGIYTNPPSSGGHRVWRSLGYLNHGVYAGLRFLFANYSLARSSWDLLGRLSATGRSHRRAGVN